MQSVQLVEISLRKAIEMEVHCCVICGVTFTGFGNNPDPVKVKGRCCDDCNEMKVIPARLAQMKR